MENIKYLLSSTRMVLAAVLSLSMIAAAVILKFKGIDFDKEIMTHVFCIVYLLLGSKMTQK